MRYQPDGTKSRAVATSRIIGLASAAGLALAAAPALASGTPAGTTIESAATATYDLPGGGTGSVGSNLVSLTVDELLDVTVAWSDPADVAAAAGGESRVLRYTITNGGNGSERFALAAIANRGGDDFDPAVDAIVLDSNGNGAFDAGLDTVYVAGANDPELAPDQSLAIFVLADIPAAARDGGRGRVDLTAAAKTGSGTPGTSFAGAGQGGGNAVVGATGGDAEAGGWFGIAGAGLAFEKSAVVRDAFGGTSPAPGSTITYTLVASASGTGTLSNVRIADAIPANTRYAPGSITLEGAALSDADDGDAGHFTGNGISVRIGDLAAGTARTVTFTVKID